MSQFIFNERTFVSCESELAEETHGFFKKQRNGFLLLNRDREPKAFVCTNDSTPFVVTATKVNKAIRYMFSTTKHTEVFLGLEDAGYGQTIDLATEAVARFHLQSKKVHTTFKELAIGQAFYQKRHPDVCSADCLKMTKCDDKTADSLEWGKSPMHPDQPCWYISQ